MNAREVVLDIANGWQRVSFAGASRSPKRGALLSSVIVASALLLLSTAQVGINLDLQFAVLRLVLGLLYASAVGSAAGWAGRGKNPE